MNSQKAEIIEIHRYLTLGGLTDLEGFIEHAKQYLMTKRLFIITVDNNTKIEEYHTETNFAVLAHRLNSALVLIDELIDANYNVVYVKELSM